MHISQIIFAKTLPYQEKFIPPTILVTPLHWGLGHATRCIPIIRVLKSIGCHVIIGSDATIQKVFRAEFSDLEYVVIPQTPISYGKDKFSTRLKLVQQSAKIWVAIEKEKAWMHHFISTRRIDGIISDNRYGCFHPAIPSVIITHQLSINTGLGKLGNYLARRLNIKLLTAFNQIWIPDFEGKEALAGTLSAPQAFQHDLKIRYLGPLSRMVAHTRPSPYALVMLLSGPEPQRSILEACLRKQATQLPYKILLVRGVVNSDAPIIIESDNLHVIDYAGSEQLEHWISQADWVVSRSGYTTVMDLSAMGKKAILIPTPGQSEQEYLARHLGATGKFYWVQQEQMDLAEDIKQAALFYKLHPVKTVKGNSMEKFVTEWVRSLK